jgi:excisionase family DNA binding protein
MSPASPPLPDYTLAEYAQIVRIGSATLQRLAKQGKLPGVYRIGSRWRVRRQVADQRGMPANRVALPRGPHQKREAEDE